MNSASRTHDRLTRGQAAILTAATLPMIGTGIAGAVGTYSNIVSEFGRAATAIGVVAAGEGTTLVLALVMVGLTLLGQPSPAPVRAGLWLVPMVAATVGLSIADNPTEAVIYAITPMAMCVSAEGMGLLARRIVIHRTGVDAEAQRRNASTIQRLAYHRAAAVGHPSERRRRRSELAAWRLAKRAGVGDMALGADLVQVQRVRLCGGADAALAAMFATSVPNQVLEPSAVQAASNRDASASLEDAVRELPAPVVREPAEQVEVNPEPVAPVVHEHVTRTTNPNRQNQAPRTGTANLSDRAAKKAAQIEQVLNLIGELGYDAVTLPVARNRTGMTKTTAYNRLTEARAIWNQRAAS